MGGKVLVPTREAVARLTAARLAADIADAPTVLIARTDAKAAKLLTSDCDAADESFIMRDEPRGADGFFRVRGGLESAIARGLSYAPYADLLWCETETPNLADARRFAEAIRAKFPGKMLAYNCSPSFNWRKNLGDAEIASFQRELGALGYKFQFITLAGFHSLNYGMFDLADGYREGGMKAFVALQEAEFAAQSRGFTAARHQREVGAGYFDRVTQVVAGGSSELSALSGSTEESQFESRQKAA